MYQPCISSLYFYNAMMVTAYCFPTSQVVFVPTESCIEGNTLVHTKKTDRVKQEG